MKSITGPSYALSEEMLARAQRVIPLGTQTFSKSKTHLPLGVSPYYIARAQGSRVWDIDGNEYIDFVSALAAINLGYRDADVTAAVREQIEIGTIFSLPHTLEIEVAEKLVEMVPCAESVRFAKNGSDATAGAIRLARAMSGRDRIAVCGYHGWQDWYIGSTTRNKGVPESVQALTHAFTYNDLSSLQSVLNDHPQQFAAVILEPMNAVEPHAGFLQGIKDLAHAHGAFLVFDETVTGFRFANGGAQEYFDVVPDIATFGKGMANGYPLSAVVGRADLMRGMEEIFFSSTHGGELLSLAAALATMRKLQREPVVARIRSTGAQLMDGIKALVESNDAGGFIRISGHPSWSFVNFEGHNDIPSLEIKTLFLQEMFARGVLTLGTHNMTYAHSAKDVEATLAVYGEVVPILASAVEEGSVGSKLRCKPLEPLFKHR